MKMRKIMRSAIALFVTAAMLVSMSNVIFATEAVDLIQYANSTEDTEINYVSLGDSMTNGYGLDGYDGDTGVYDYGHDSYANKFAEMLADDGATVNHIPLAMSAMRPEDLNFLLHLDYDDPAVSALLDKYPTDDNVYYRCSNHSGVAYEDIVYCHDCKWDWVELPGYDTHVDDYPAWWSLVHGENWSNLIGYGDYWTWKELTEDYRFNTACTYIKAYSGNGDPDAVAAQNNIAGKSNYRWPGNGYSACYIAEYYQKSVMEADVISLALGNGNFGVWLMGRITSAIMDHDGIGRNGAYNLEDVLKQCTPDLRIKAYELLAELDPYIEQYIGSMMGALDDAKRESIKNVCTYAVVSFLVNYKGVIERILELNPDVEIVMLGLMNTYAGDSELAEEGTVTIGNILDVLFPPLNAFIAGLPTYFQTVEKSDLYKDAQFYYAEEYTIECLIHTFGDEKFYNWEGVSRDRFVTGLVGECDCGRNCTDAEACGDWDYGIFWELLDGYDMGGVTVERITINDVKHYYDLTDVQRAEYAVADKDKTASIALYLAIEDAVCKSGKLAPVTLSTLTGLSLDDPSLLGKALGNFTTEQEKVIANYYDAAIEGLKNAGITEPTQTNINDISMVLSLPEAMSNALWTDPDLCSMLAVVARNKLGNGLGAHPSSTGHAALAEEMMGAYTNKYTAQDKTLSNIIEVIKNRDVLMNDIVIDRINNGEGIVAKCSNYVAIGDDVVLANNSYADKFASEMGFSGSAYKKIAQAGLTVEDTLAVIEKNADTISSADLITIGYNSQAFTTKAFAQISNIMMNKPVAEYNWAVYVGEENVPYVEQSLADIRAELVEQGLNISLNGRNVTDMLMAAIETYAYNFVAYSFNYPKVIDAIHELSPEALVVVVGLYNTLDNIKLSIEDNEFDIGEYIQYLVDAGNAMSIAYVFETENTVYVDAPAVETVKASSGNASATDLTGFVWEILFTGDANYLPSADGQEYIKNQLFATLTVADHNYATEVTAPTCLDGGYTTYTCTLCGDSKTSDETPATGHAYEAVVTKPTCLDGGYTTYTCTVCADSKIADKTSATGHTFGDWIVISEPTCTEKGTETRTCACGASENREVSALGHDAVSHAAQAPTCTEIGWDAYETCSRCDYCTYEEIPATGHTEVTDAAVDATCTETGLTEGKHCSACNAVIKAQETVEALGHDFADEWTVDKAATATERGTKSRHCSRCDEVTDEIEYVDSSLMFVDIKANEWYTPAVDYAVLNGLMNGVNNTHFDPEGAMTRAMVVTVLYRLEGEPETKGDTPFNDLKADWYKKAVAWAYENEIVNGTSTTTFAPEGNVTREQVATILYRYAQFKEYDTSATTDLSIFPDADKTGSWAKTALSWAYAEEIITGASKNGQTVLDPNGEASRAQVATILMRFCER